MNKTNFDQLLGKPLVLIESGHCCLAKLTSVSHDGNWFDAEFERNQHPSVACEYGLISTAGEKPTLNWSPPLPFQSPWAVKVSSEEFYFEEEFWQAQFLWGGGFRVFFNPRYVEEFSRGSLDWLWQHYADEEDCEDDPSDSETD